MNSSSEEILDLVHLIREKAKLNQQEKKFGRRDALLNLLNAMLKEQGIHPQKEFLGNAETEMENQA